MPSINNFLKGFQDGLPGMKDFRHASRLYLDDNFRLMPKQKFLFYVRFLLDDTVAFDANTLNPNEKIAVRCEDLMGDDLKNKCVDFKDSSGNKICDYFSKTVKKQT